VIGVLVREAIGRLLSPSQVQGRAMLVIACFGLAANLANLLLLSRHSRSDINVRGAYLHVVGDLLGSVAAVVAGILLVLTGWNRADPLLSLAICAVLGMSSWGLMKDAIHILLEGTPSHLDLEAVRSALLGLEGVREVHDLHLWSLSSGTESMTGHLVVRDGVDPQAVLEAGSDMLDKRFGVHHVTLQIESGKKR
jgi:cobalt-zinc-cadmium efflux system protein